MLYQKPILEILELKRENVICASVGGVYEGGDGNESGASGSWISQPSIN